MKQYLALIMTLLCSSIFVESSELLDRFQMGINPSFDVKYEGDPLYQHMDQLDLVASFSGTAPVILEAGAHEGEDTLRFLKKWPLARILAFEPNSRARSRMPSILESSPQVKIFPYALDNYNGEKFFYLAQGNEGASSLLPSSTQMQHHYQGEVMRVRCVKLDQWCKSEGIHSIDFMWLDMEGKELDALSESVEILKTTKVIYTETNFQKFREGMAQYEDLKAFLEEQGFVVVAHWYIPEWQGNALFVRK